MSELRSAAAVQGLSTDGFANSSSFCEAKTFAVTLTQTSQKGYRALKSSREFVEDYRIDTGEQPRDM